MQILKKGMERGHIPSSKGKPHNFANPFNLRNGGDLGGRWPVIASNPELIYIPFNGFTEEIENMELTQKYHNDINLASAMILSSVWLILTSMVLSERKAGRTSLKAMYTLFVEVWIAKVLKASRP